jgi:hypothetical protein
VSSPLDLFHVCLCLMVLSIPNDRQCTSSLLSMVWKRRPARPWLSVGSCLYSKSEPNYVEMNTCMIFKDIIVLYRYHKNKNIHQLNLDFFSSKATIYSKNNLPPTPIKIMLYYNNKTKNIYCQLFWENARTVDRCQPQNNTKRRKQFPFCLPAL